MKKIKFRVWDKQKNKMICSAYDLENFNMFISPFTGNIEFFERPKNIYMSPNADSIALVHWIKPYKIRENSDDLVLMQFTGLHDKNGKKIYEGDILKSDESFWKNENIVVNYQNGGFYPFRFECQEQTDLLDPKRSEIIGNIYENPELLEEK